VDYQRAQQDPRATGRNDKRLAGAINRQRTEHAELKHWISCPAAGQLLDHGA
jgi:hypothetical protein